MKHRIYTIALAGLGFLAGPAVCKTAVFVSAMGEPYWTNQEGVPPFDQWLEVADRDGDGTVSKAEFREDAKAFFESLDTSGDLTIDGLEMAKYEQLAPGKTRAAGGGAARASSARPKPKASAPVENGQVPIVTGGDAPSATRIHPGGGPIDYDSVPQPVAMADRDLNGRVTLEEFLKTANMRFAKLDSNSDGRLTLKEAR